MKDNQVYDGEWVRWRWVEQFIQCCDCGLVHSMDAKVKGGKLYIRAFRENRMTHKAREKEKHESR